MPRPEDSRGCEERPEERVAHPILEMNQHFTLGPGKWKVARRDGTKEVVESDGTYSLDMVKVCWVIHLVPNEPARSPQTGLVSGSQSP
jgi:hypothetical protein